MMKENINAEDIDNSDDHIIINDNGNLKQVTVLDFLKNTLRIDEETRENRMSICRQCDRFTAKTICSECKCIMKLKTWIGPAECPLHKWKAV